ncbi:hypothetical protein FKP32DRAFT_1284387 [Trametes sanguinea]|nr:hypothetical protein FKP32DRAFT_1284387 [Trametes sanguinea]
MRGGREAARRRGFPAFTHGDATTRVHTSNPAIPISYAMRCGIAVSLDASKSSVSPSDVFRCLGVGSNVREKRSLLLARETARNVLGQSQSPRLHVSISQVPFTAISFTCGYQPQAPDSRTCRLRGMVSACDFLLGYFSTFDLALNTEGPTLARSLQPKCSQTCTDEGKTGLADVWGCRASPSRPGLAFRRGP